MRAFRSTFSKTCFVECTMRMVKRRIYQIQFSGGGEMGLKTKGGFYCDHCEHPVVAHKGTSRIRNTAAVLGAPLTGGGSLAVTSYNDWHCPACGSPVRRLPRSEE